MSIVKNRFALIVALSVFVVSEFSGASFEHAVERAMAGFGITLVLQILWKWMLWPWLRSTLEARGTSATTEAGQGQETEPERQQERKAA